MLLQRCNMTKAISGAVRVAIGRLVMTSQSMAPHIIPIMELGTDVYFTNSMNHWPRSHRDEKVSIETAREQSVIVTSQLLMYRWFHNR